MNETFAKLAELFRYPDARLVFDAAGDGDLVAFAREIAVLDAIELEATYTATFDLAPSCSPYLGEHLFGEESRDRARLLVGLRTNYAKADMDVDERELPDHVSLVLAYAAHDETEEWSDLVQMILLPSLTKMDGLLRPTTNPYRHLVAAALHACEAAAKSGAGAPAVGI